MLEAKFRFYDIVKCGYYAKGEKNPKFSDPNDILTKLAAWARDGRELINTTTYEVSIDDDKYRTLFCDFSVDSNSQDCVLVLWNEVINHNGTIYGIEPMKKPGNTEMLHTEFTKDAIPGFPSYFWFIPKRMLLVSVKFEHSTTGKGNLDEYVQGFMELKSPYRVISKEKIIGYSKTPTSTDRSNFGSPKFLVKAKLHDDLEAELLANISRITKIIKTQSLHYHLPNDKGILERFFDTLISKNDREEVELSGVKQITQELSIKPSEEYVKQIIHNYYESKISPSVKKIGFGYSDGTRVILNGSNVSFSYEINLKYKANTILAASDLLGALTNQKIKLLAHLNTSSFTKEQGVNE